MSNDKSHDKYGDIVSMEIKLILYHVSISTVQEMRAKLQADEPDIGFGDLGRRLGEMWHSLKEEEKEDYR